MIAKLSQVGKYYQVGDQRITALEPTDMVLNEGELLLIIGPSGSGKTTLLSLLGCVLYPSVGKLVVDGNEVNNLNEKELAKLRLHKIGFVFQNFNLLAPLQFEVFCFHIAYHGALVRHFSGMNTAGWSHGTPNEDLGCITSHEQSTRCSFYSGLLGVLVATKKSFRAEQIVRTRLPTETFAHACVEINSKSTLFVCIPKTPFAFFPGTQYCCTSP